MSLESMHDLLVHELKDLHSAEKQLVKALPQMAKAASHPKLREAIENHLKETQEQATRIEKALELVGATGRGETCAAMQGLIEEGKKLVSEKAAEAVRDAGIIASAQRIEHYEMAAYGCARAFAEALGEREVVELLSSSLEEEATANESLTELAEKTINPLAIDAHAEVETPARSRAR